MSVSLLRILSQIITHAVIELHHANLEFSGTQILNIHAAYTYNFTAHHSVIHNIQQSIRWITIINKQRESGVRVDFIHSTTKFGGRLYTVVLGCG